MAAVRVLTQRELQRAALGRQLLLARSRLGIPRALERVGGLQAQYAPSMYVGLWSRLHDFERDDLTRALEQRTVVQGTLMRSTIHLVSASDYWPLAIGVRASRRAWWIRTYKVEAREMRAAARRARRALEAEGVMKAIDVDRLAGPAAAIGLHLWLDLVRVPPSGTWERRRADLLALADAWVGPAPALNAALAVEHVVRRYLGGFGPASVDEIAAWSGIPVAEVTAALDVIELRTFATEDGGQLVDLPRQRLPTAHHEAPVRFVSTWEAMLLVHARRALLIREEDRVRIFAKTMPQSKPTFLVDGEVAGTWRHIERRVEIEPFRPLAREARRVVEAEAARLARLYE